MDPVIPTFVNSATLRFAVTGRLLNGSAKNLWTQVNFSTSGSFPPTYTATNFQADTAAWLTPILSPIIQGVNFSSFLFWRINTPAGLKQAALSTFFGSPDFGDPRIQMQAICITLKTDNHGRSGVGKTFWLWFHDSEISGSSVLPSFATRMAPFLTWLTSSKTLGGVTFRPAVWSRKLGIMQPITSVTVCKYVSWVRKRRMDGTRINVGLPWPLVW